jgi:hypothetical protein
LHQNPLDVVDVGTNTPLPDGRTLEAGEMVNPETAMLTSYEEIWRDEECDGAVVVRNISGSIWRARAGEWQLALGRTAEGKFWAWQAQRNGSGEDVWTRSYSTPLGVGLDGSEYLPPDCSGWQEGSLVEWGGERWSVLHNSIFPS